MFVITENITKRPVYNKPQMNISGEKPEIPPTVFAAKFKDSSDIRVLFFLSAGEWETL